ncbi:MAG TPA: LytTR family DNA-binding domain-containing protein [Acidobacteriaceae bacterium]|nr:LytTR family DNA-binding domain-containing protein [Acidobacteriaceae bacterium]
MTLRAFLVDDEPLALDRLRRLLVQTGRVDVIGATTKPEDAVAALRSDPPDVCFLDIQMPRLSGFDILARLARQPIVIFTTAYDQYALQAFGVNSVDYLLKPIEPEALARALDKVERLRASAPLAQPDLETLFRRLAGSLHAPQPEYPERIASRLGDRLCFLDLDRITHFYAQDKLTWAVCDGKPYCIDSSIAQLEEKLDPKQFARIHRATLVNLAWIREVSPLPGGALNLRLKDPKATDLTVARDRAHAFRTLAGL